MTNRHPALDKLVRSLEAAFLEQKPTGPWKDEALEAFRSLNMPHPPSGAASATIDACRHLEPALAQAREEGNTEVRSIAEAFGELAPQLTWARRSGSEREDVTFHDGHANAIVIGPKGLEAREDCWLGVSLMAPNVQYPVHRHPPEELYVVLSEGDWFRQDANWFTPGMGGIVYNPSGSIHSMKSTEAPLLAFWVLWGGRSLSL